ncbi:MAG: hypothetical protein NXI22_16525 [bacterium]|nr:hypothetical protein [bacterium]
MSFKAGVDMCDSTVVRDLSNSSFWQRKIREELPEEDAQRIRERHQELVEEWLDFADFATELFNLHKKYGIEHGESGYVAYRKFLKQQYDQRLADVGPTVDPLGEGCQCIFCKMHAEEKPEPTPEIVEPEPKPESNCPVDDADQLRETVRFDGPHSGAYHADVLGRLRKKIESAKRSPTLPEPDPACARASATNCRVLCTGQLAENSRMVDRHSGLNLTTLLRCPQKKLWRQSRVEGALPWRSPPAPAASLRGVSASRGPPARIV